MAKSLGVAKQSRRKAGVRINTVVPASEPGPISRRDLLRRQTSSQALYGSRLGGRDDEIPHSRESVSSEFCQLVCACEVRRCTRPSARSSNCIFRLFYN